MCQILSQFRNEQQWFPILHFQCHSWTLGSCPLALWVNNLCHVNTFLTFWGSLYMVPEVSAPCNTFTTLCTVCFARWSLKSFPPQKVLHGDPEKFCTSSPKSCARRRPLKSFAQRRPLTGVEPDFRPLLSAACLLDITLLIVIIAVIIIISIIIIIIIIIIIAIIIIIMFIIIIIIMPVAVMRG